MKFNTFKRENMQLLSIFAVRNNPDMAFLGNTISFIATFTVIMSVTLIVMQSILKLHNGNGCISGRQEKITVIIAIILASALIPLYYFPY